MHSDSSETGEEQLVNKAFNEEMRIMKGLKVKSFSLVILMVLMSVSAIPIQNLTLSEEKINLTSGRAMSLYWRHMFE